MENKFEFVLDSIVDYPQNIKIQYYPDCTTEMRKEIEADIRVLPKAVANIFITDATNPVLVKGESILLLHQNILQKKYQQMLNDMNVRINQFKKRTGQQLHQAFLSASNHQQKDSIERSRYFKFDVPGQSFQSLLQSMPANLQQLSLWKWLYSS